VRVLDHPHHGLHDRAVVDQDEIVQALPQDRLRQLQAAAGRQPLGERVVGGGGHAPPAPGLVARRRLRRLGTDHPDRRVDRLGRDTRPSRAAAAAHRHEDRVDVRHVFEDLQRIRAHARDQVWLVAGVDVAVAVLGGQGRGVVQRVIELRAVEDHLGAHAAHGGHLARVSHFGHDDLDRRAEQPPGIGD